MAARFQFEQWVPFSLEQVFLFFACPENLPRIMPPSTRTRIEHLKLSPPPAPPENKEGLANHLAGIGSEITTSFQLLPLLPYRAIWIALITEFEWNHHFADVQKIGPFRRFHHRHELQMEVREAVNGTRVTDIIDLEVGFAWAGTMVEKLFIAREMRRTFAYRQKALLKLLNAR